MRLECDDCAVARPPLDAALVVDPDARIWWDDAAGDGGSAAMPALPRTAARPRQPTIWLPLVSFRSVRWMMMMTMMRCSAAAVLMLMLLPNRTLRYRSSNPKSTIDQWSDGRSKPRHTHAKANPKERKGRRH